MNDNFYKQLMKESPTGYAYHKIVCDEDGVPYDYKIIEVNAAFEKLTGLKGSDVVSRKMTEALSDIKEIGYDWIKLCGEIAINGGKKEIEQYYKPMKKWYRINVYSPEKYYFITHFTDLSKEKEQFIEPKNLQYRLLSDVTLEGSAIHESGFVKDLNYSLSKLLGYERKEMINKNLMEFVHEEDRTIVRKNIAKGYTHPYEVRAIRKNGEIFFVELESRNFHAQDNELSVVAIRDIAQKKKVQEALQESKASLATLLESIPAPVFYKDVDGRYLGFNRSFEDFFGKTKNELIGKSVFDINPVELARIYHAKDVELFEQTGTQTYENQVRNARGILFDVIFHKATMTNSRGEITGLIGIILDITERKRLEVALENEKKFLETTLISVGEGVISTDNHGNIVFLNKVAEFLTGWTQEAAKGKSIEEVFTIVHGFTRKKSENIVKKVLDGGKTLELANNTILISKEGIERPIEDSVAPIMQENGQIIGVVLVFRDVTEKKIKQKEIEFLSFHDQLTGVYNRRFFEEELNRLDTKRNLHLSIIIADVNGLKLANDAFGHAVGDRVLQRVAEVIKKECRADDIIARIGGDEFVILLPKTNYEETEIVVNRIKKEMKKEKVNAISLSVSFGWETKQNTGEKITDTFKAC